MGPLLGFVILAGVQLATPIIQSHFQNKETAKNRNEAIGLANIQRSDRLKQQRIENYQAKKMQRVNDKSLSFQEDMVKEGIKDQEKEKSYLFNKANQSFIQNAAKNFGMQDDYYEKRSLIQNRGY